MAALRLLCLARRLQLLGGELPDRLEQEEAWLSCPARGGERGCARSAPTAGREARARPAPRRQRPPRDRSRPGRPRPRGTGAARSDRAADSSSRLLREASAGARAGRAPAGEQRERLFEPREERRRRQQADAAGGELECERQPVEPLADLADRLLVPGRGEVGRRRRAARAVNSSSASSVSSGGSGNSTSPASLSGERLVTSRRRPGHCASSSPMNGAASRSCSRLSRQRSSSFSPTASSEVVPVLDLEREGERRGNERRIRDRRELDERRPVREPPLETHRSGQGQPGLADPARAGHASRAAPRRRAAPAPRARAPCR